jgi:nucleotide-binding universal stress UspA family protein
MAHQTSRQAHTLSRILVLLGVTPSSLTARACALQLAKRTEAVLAGLSGIDLPYIEKPMLGRAGSSAYKNMQERRLSAQARDERKRLKDAFEGECGREGIAFESLSFEGDPSAEINSAVETCDLVVTGHDTAFRGTVREPLSEAVENFAKTCPRPIIVCPDAVPHSDRILVAYDGSAAAMRAVQMFALFGLTFSTPIKVMTVSKSLELAKTKAIRAAEYLRTHSYQVEEAPIASRRHPADVLREEVEENDIGMLVMGAYGNKGLRQLVLGSTTHRLLESPGCVLFLYH